MYHFNVAQMRRDVLSETENIRLKTMSSNDQPQIIIKQHLLEAIEAGQLGEGGYLPSENDLSQQFGVDRHWARRALRELELEGYIIRSQGRRSVVAPTCQRRHSLALGSSPTFAVAIPDYVDAYDQSIVNGFMQLLSSKRLQGHVYSVHLDEDEERTFLSRAPDTGLAGLAIWLQHGTPAIANALDSLQRRRFPVVQIDRHLDSCETDYVVTDNEAVGFSLAEMVLERGHTLIGFASVFEDVSSVRDRFTGFRLALESRDIEFHEKFYKRMTSGDVHSIHAAITEMMSYREGRPTAIVCIHDEVAHNIIKEVLHLGYEIPNDVEIAMLDDLHQSQFSRLPVLTVRQRSREMGRMAAELLFERFGNPDLPPRHIKLPIDREPYDE